MLHSGVFLTAYISHFRQRTWRNYGSGRCSLLAALAHSLPKEKLWPQFYSLTPPAALSRVCQVHTASPVRSPRHRGAF